MSGEEIYQAQQLVASVHDIAASMKQIHEELSTLSESIKQVDTVLPDLKEFTESSLIELQQTRVKIAESLTIANDLYHTGLDAMKEGAL